MTLIQFQPSNKKTETKLTAAERKKSAENFLSKPRNFKNFIQAYLHYTKGQESTERIHKWVAVSTVAAALERKTYLDAGHFKVFPNFYIFIIGDSGQVRKSTSTQIGYDLIKQVTNVNFMSERLTDRSLIDQLMRSSSEFYMPDDSEQKQSAVYAYASELVVFMREIAGTISELLTTFWDCPKDWCYETKQDGELSIDAPCLNILGCSTPSWLQRSIPVEEMEGGLASRIVFVVEPRPPARYNAWGVTRDKTFEDFRQKLIEDLRQINSLVGKFTYTKAAEDFYGKWYVEHRKGSDKVTDIRMKGYYNRKPVTIWKLAMVFAVSEGNKLVFDKEHLELAIEWLNEIEEDMLSAFNTVGQNKLAAGAKEVKTMLMLNLNGMSQGEILCQIYSRFNGVDCKQLLSDIVAMDSEIVVQYVNGKAIFALTRAARESYEAKMKAEEERLLSLGDQNSYLQQSMNEL